MKNVKYSAKYQKKKGKLTYLLETASFIFYYISFLSFYIGYIFTYVSILFNILCMGIFKYF